MPKFSKEKFRDFFKYYKGDPSQIAAIDMLYKDLPDSLVSDESGWVKEWRKPKPAQTNSKRKTNQQGINLIKAFEGLRLEAYYDSVGVKTIGYGHTGPGVAKGKITEKEAEDLLRSDLSSAESDVLSLVKVPLDDHQFGALVSFAFNLGGGALAESTLLRKLNSGDYSGASQEFRKWTFAGGQELPGLVARRSAESKLFSTNLNSSQSPSGAVSVVNRVKILAQNYPKSCGQTSVAMCINSLTGKSLTDSYIDQHFGYDLAGALNSETNMSGWTSPDFVPGKWDEIQRQLVRGIPVVFGVNGPNWSPSGYGHIILICEIDGSKIKVADPNGGVWRSTTKNELESCPPHHDGRFWFKAP